MNTPPGIFILGNSGSGKTTLAKRLTASDGLGHLDLDTLAWDPVNRTTRRPLEASAVDCQTFFSKHPNGWVAEGCYGDIVARLLPQCTELFFMDPGEATCIANNKSRPWEPHKYPSKADQDANLEFLLQWVREYYSRDDVCSHHNHIQVFKGFNGKKQLLRSLLSPV